MLFFIELYGYPAVNEREVYRVNIRIENYLIEMPDDYGQRGGKGRVAGLTGLA